MELLHPSWDDQEFDWSSVDACLIRTTWDYHHRREEFKQWALRTEALTRLFNPAALIGWNTSKLYLRDLADQGVPVIETEWLGKGSQVDLGEVLRRRGWQRGFMKPVVASTAHGTCRFDNHGESLKDAQSFLNDFLTREAMQVQPYLEQVESHGEESMIFFDGEYSHSVRKVPVPGDYRVQDDFGATDQPHEHTAEEIELACGVMQLIDSTPDWVGANHSGPMLYARADWLRDAGGELRLCEFEAVEPSLFLRHCDQAAGRLASALMKRIRVS